MNHDIYTRLNKHWADIRKAPESRPKPQGTETAYEWLLENGSEDMFEPSIENIKPQPRLNLLMTEEETEAVARILNNQEPKKHQARKYFIPLA